MMRVSYLFAALALTSTTQATDSGPPCLDLQGCYLENALTGSSRQLATTDSYDLVQDDSKWFWTVQCIYNPLPAVVTFSYLGNPEFNEKHSPFYMGADDENNKPFGVNPFLSTCGYKSFDVYSVMPGCGSPRTTYYLEAICDTSSNLPPAFAPTAGPTVSPCRSMDLVLSKSSLFLDALDFQVASQARDRRPQGQSRSSGKGKGGSSGSRSRSGGKNDNKTFDRDDDNKPVSFNFHLLTQGGEACSLNVGATLTVDTQVFGTPIKFDGDIVVHGLARDYGDRLCLGGLQVAHTDIRGLAGDMLELLEHFVLKMDLATYLSSLMGDEICL